MGELMVDLHIPLNHHLSSPEMEALFVCLQLNFKIHKLSNTDKSTKRKKEQKTKVSLEEAL